MRGNPGLKGRLLENSTDAYVLALETINRLSIKYRLETFAYLICNAWELMLKAKIIQDDGDRKSIYYKKKRGEPRRSLSLRDCLRRVFPDDFDPTRRNIELVADLRDEATHLVIGQIPNAARRVVGRLAVGARARRDDDPCLRPQPGPTRPQQRGLAPPAGERNRRVSIRFPG